MKKINSMLKNEKVQGNLFIAVMFSIIAAVMILTRSL